RRNAQAAGRRGLDLWQSGATRTPLPSGERSAHVVRRVRGPWTIENARPPHPLASLATSPRWGEGDLAMPCLNRRPYCPAAEGSPRSQPVRSGHQDRRSRGLAAFEVAVRLLRLLERVLLVDRDLHLAAADDVEQVVCGRDEVFALGRVGVERRPGREE